MIRHIGFAVLISVLLYILVLRRSEGFSNMPRLTDDPAFSKLSDDQVLELFGIINGTLGGVITLDAKPDTDEANTAKGLVEIVYNKQNQTDVKGLKNKVMNKAAENKNFSVLFTVLESNFKGGIKLYKKLYNAQQKNDRNAIELVIEDSKALAKKGIRQIKDKIPNFPFSKFVKDQFPEGFVEAPKPSASECKRFFKCSSIYAA